MLFKKFQLVLLLIPVQNIFAQQDTVIKYVDYYDNAAEQEHPVYYIKVYKQKPSDVLFKRQKFLKFDHKLVADGWSNDAAGDTRQGTFISYSYKGTIDDSGRYENNKKEGMWTGHRFNGTINYKYFYSNGVLIGNNVRWYENGKASDSLVLDNNGLGTGYGFYETGEKSYEGKYSNGEKEGTWTYFYNEPGNHKSMEVLFIADSSRSWKCFTMDGSPQDKNCFFEREAIFPGGDNAFRRYLGEELGSSSFSKHMKDLKYYKVVISFVVSKDGKIVDAKAEEGTQPKLDRIAESIIRKSGPWVPAMQYNRPVNAYRRQPITFTAE